jgi:hypothetical protein
MRGQKSDEGSTRTAPNGYHYTKRSGKWRLTHHLLMEDILGRPLMSWERVKFKDGNRRHLDKKNLLLVDKGGVTGEQKIAQLELQIKTLTELRDSIAAELASK